MAKIIKFPIPTNKNDEVIKAIKDSDLLNQAFAKLKEQTGLDYYKLIVEADPREKQKQKMLYAQEKMREEQSETTPLF
jgi:hypothetical protein